MDSGYPSGPAVEFEDPERFSLISTLAELVGAARVTSTAWGCLWLSDKQRHRDAISRIQISQESSSEARKKGSIRSGINLSATLITIVDFLFLGLAMYEQYVVFGPVSLNAKLS